jgi:vancomycin permeability regulator SanA
VALWLALAAVGLLIVAAVAWGEYAHFRVARLGFGVAQPSAPQSEAVIVLGYKNRRPDRANALNRWRVRAAVRSADFSLARSDLVFCGTTRNPAAASEAALMARYATRACGVPESRVVLEERSRSTWENISYAIPLVEDADQIKIVSNPTHALRGRLYLHRLRPDLAARLVQAQDYRPGELWPLKPLFALHALRYYGFRYVAFTRRDLAAIAQQKAPHQIAPTAAE